MKTPKYPPFGPRKKRPVPPPTPRTVPPYDTFTGPTCRGSLMLGTGCQRCEKCVWEANQMHLYPWSAAISDQMNKNPLPTQGLDIPTPPDPSRPRPAPDWVSSTCKGERCSVCNAPAAAKIGEEIALDDPFHSRHNLTAYVCEPHFRQIFGEIGVAWLVKNRRDCRLRPAPE